MAETVQNRTDLSKKTGAVLVREGSHPARLVDVQEFTNAFGVRVGLVFRLEGGEFDGVGLMESAAASGSPRGKLSELLRGVGGGHTAEAARQAIGRNCRVTVRHELTRQGKPYAAIAQTFE